ncbi:Vegetative incompatibility protein HET-E-1 [Trametes pubescens]|uniref:Vegetative incompatibility protein HET-E-1 n=1 Tax=Trametes pubescens TaxID=154538 RepID=A0A1M2V905_TRAPU|nr:Vegetative incompatibility protein HET-E-1 [Trametes pubescens]
MPRFLDTLTGQFVWIHEAGKVPYAILSHTWSPEEEGGEQSYEDVRRLQAAVTELEKAARERSPTSSGVHGDASSESSLTILSHPGLSPKIKGICKIAREAGYRLVWIDSCCIDKTSSAELSEAINSMFEWYSEADVCYAYLADVPDDEDPRLPDSAFRASRWHQRGWTLQELIAPERVVFLSCTWRFLGTKTGLASTLEQITNVDFAILTGRAMLSSISVTKRMSWAATRWTTRVEDRAYSLLGIFDVHMSPIYGEGANAFLRLQEEIIKTIPDQSIFAWGRTCTLLSLDKARFSVPGSHLPSLLAPSPTHFEGFGDVTPLAPADFAVRLNRPPWYELPPLHCVFTPQGVRVRLLGTLLFRNDRVAHAVLHADGAVVGCDECERLARPDACTLALLRCQDGTGALIALALYCESPSIEGQENLAIASHAYCGNRIHAPFRIVRISRDALDEVRSLLSPKPVKVYILRYYQEPLMTEGRRIGFAKQPGVDLWLTGPDREASFRFAPGCVEELNAVGFRASPLECQRSVEEIVLTTYLARGGPEGLDQRIRMRLTLTRSLREQFGYLPRPQTVVHACFAITPHREDRLSDEKVTRSDGYTTGVNEASHTAVFAAELTSTRVVAQAEFDISVDASSSTDDPSWLRILRLRLERPLTSSTVADSNNLLLSVEVSEPYRCEATDELENAVGHSRLASRDDCQAQTAGFAGNKHHKFASLEQAKQYLAENGVPTGSVNIASSSSTPPSSRPLQHGSALRGRTHGSTPYARTQPPTAKVSQDSARSGSSNSQWAALASEVIEDESGWDVVYSDGACKGNGKIGSIAGVGVWWGHNDARNIAERCPGGQTNNRAELIAIVRVLETTPHTKRPLLIKTDSKYSISCFRHWMPKWLKNNFRTASGEAVKNAPLIRYLSALLDLRAREGQKVHLQYIKGHAGHEGNEGADYQANIGATMPLEPERDWEALMNSTVRAQRPAFFAKLTPA